MSVSFFDITRQNSLVKEKINSAVLSVANSGRYILGENVSSLEKEVGNYCGAKYAVGVASGTDALHLALRAVGIKEGDEVITTPFTFVATAEAIAYCSARPVFVDIEPNTFNLDPRELIKAINPRTKAIIPVHLYGQACKMDDILAVAQKYNLKIIEDCAQAMGAEFAGKKVGAFGDAGCFSFFPTKNIGCFGDGGMATTNSEEIFEALKVLRGHGSRKTYHYDIIGYNSRLDEMQAAIVRVKLPNLDLLIQKRRDNAAHYFKYFNAFAQIRLPAEFPKAKHTYNQFTIRVKERDALFAHLKSSNVSSMVYYPLSLHLQQAFKNLGYKLGDFPQSEKAQAEVLSLPIYPELKEEELLAVCRAIKEFYTK